jgi:hypothetical protein
MQKILSAAFLALVIIGCFSLPASAAESDTLAKFKGGIGVIPVSNVDVAGSVVTVNRNTVRGVNPAGQIWVIDTLDARVRTNGDIRVKGTGLVLGGGNNAGRATGQNVFATLICEATGLFTERSTDPEGVPLTTEGNFEINDVLAPLPAGGCASPMLLIRNAANGGWFAVGILDD